MRTDHGPSLAAKAAMLAGKTIPNTTLETTWGAADDFIFVTYLDFLGSLACSSVRSAIANGVELAILG